MMRRLTLAVIVPLLALAACATPRESCVASARRDLNVVSRLIDETRANLARGYALERRQEIVTIPHRCDGVGPDGSPFTYDCPRTTTRTRQVPVAIDLNAERAKLNSLLERQGQMQRASDAAIRQCLATYPE